LASRSLLLGAAVLWHQEANDCFWVLRFFGIKIIASGCCDTQIWF